MVLKQKKSSAKKHQQSNKKKSPKKKILKRGRDSLLRRLLRRRKKRKEENNRFLRQFWLKRASLNNGLFFWGLTSALLMVLFLGLISIFAADVSVTVIVIPPAAASISAAPNPVNYNTASTLTWSSTDATSCTASDDWSGAKAISGTESTGNLTVAQTYTIVCSGPGGNSAPASVTINVSTSLPPPISQPSAPSLIFSATPISVLSGQPSTLAWSALYASSCVASGDWSGTKNVSGSESTGPLTVSQSYTLTCSGAVSPPATATVVVNVINAPIVNLYINKSIAYGGETVTLTWDSTNTTSCSASSNNSWSGSKPLNSSPSGEDVVLPETIGGYTFTLTCDDVSKSVSVNVGLPPVIINFYPDKTSVTPGDGVVLSWEVTNATSCNALGASDWFGAIGLIGSKNITLPLAEGSYSYTLSCSNDSGSVARTVNISVSKLEEIKEPVEEPEIPPGEREVSETFEGVPGGIQVTMTVDNAMVEADPTGKIRLTWSSVGADTCIASGMDDWVNGKPTNGSMILKNPGVVGIYTYVLTCQNKANQETIAYARISVIEPKRIEGFFNITETEILPEAAPVAPGKVLEYTPTFPEIMEKSELTQAFSISETKTPLQNILSIIIAALLLLLILYSTYLFYKNSKNWGYVFDAQTNKPILDAKVEIRNAHDGLILQTILTDYKGRFHLKLIDLKDGEYLVNVEKRDYLFPSKIFARKTGLPKIIYLGKRFKLIIKKGLKLKIPIDPIVVNI